jgi:hypothetical protein
LYMVRVNQENRELYDYAIAVFLSFNVTPNGIFREQIKEVEHGS